MEKKNNPPVDIIELCALRKNCGKKATGHFIGGPSALRPFDIIRCVLLARRPRLSHSATLR